MRGRSVFVLLGCVLLATCALAGWRTVETERAPCPRFGHTLVNVGGRFLLFGGLGACSPQDLFNDLWEYNPALEDWEEITPVTLPPPARKGHAAVAHGGKMYVIAGFTEERNGKPGFLNDVWAYDPAAHAWERVPTRGPGPAPRSAPGAVSCAGRIWLLGGYGEEGPLTDLRALDPESGTWERRADFPGKRLGRPAMSCSGGRIVVYGGRDAG